MWIYDFIDKAGLLLPRNNKRGFSSRKQYSKTRKSDLPEMNLHSFKNKKVVTTGEFFPTSEEALTERLVQEKAHVLPQMTQETDILICGKYPDWMLIEEAKMIGIKIIFIDKASDLFSKPTTEHYKSRQAFSSQVPLGV